MLNIENRCIKKKAVKTVLAGVMIGCVMTGKMTVHASEITTFTQVMPCMEVQNEYIRQIAEEAREKEEARRQKEEQDQELMASIIFCEAGNQSYVGQVAVGAVVMNRLNSDLYPDTLEEVIYQSGQFGPAVTGWLDRVRAESGYTESAMQAAKDAIAGANPVGDCLFFDQGGYGMQIGAHYFH